MHAASLCSGAGVEVEVPVEEMNGGGSNLWSNVHAYEVVRGAPYRSIFSFSVGV